MTRSVTRWWWVRHAPVRDAGGRVTGQLDLEADCSDHEQIARVAVRLPQNPVWMVEPAQAHAPDLDVLHTACGITGTAVEVERDVAEQDFGDWQGKTYAELEASDADRYKKFWIAPGTTRPPGGGKLRRRHDAGRARGRAPLDRACRARHRRGRPWRIDPRRGCAGAGPRPGARLALQVDPLSLTRLDRIADASGVVWSIGCVNA